MLSLPLLLIYFILDEAAPMDDLANIVAQHFCNDQDVAGSITTQPKQMPEESEDTTLHIGQKDKTNAEPKYKEYATVEAREKSFKGLKKKLPKKRKMFAEAGFFYKGVYDHVQCFYCGGELKDLQAGDNPFEEHAGWYGDCLFIKAVKGEEFVKSFSEPVRAYCKVHDTL